MVDNDLTQLLTENGEKGWRSMMGSQGQLWGKPSGKQVVDNGKSLMDYPASNVWLDGMSEN